jgi:hypothetical protein
VWTGSSRVDLRAGRVDRQSGTVCRSPEARLVGTRLPGRCAVLVAPHPYAKSDRCDPSARGGCWQRHERASNRPRSLPVPLHASGDSFRAHFAFGTAPYEPLRADARSFENHQPHFTVPGGVLGDDPNHSLWVQASDAVGWRRIRVRLLSLTQGDNSRGTEVDVHFRCPWARARMWEQYADNHRGVCLVFDLRRCLRQSVRT